MKTLLYVAAMTGLFTLPSCLKNDPAVPADTINYPSTQGDYWVYKVTNYQKNTVDTVTVSVVGSLKDPLQPGDFTILQLKWPDKVDSQFVSIVNDTLSFYTRTFLVPENQNAYILNNLIVYPLSIGESYTPSSRPYNFPNTIRMISSQSANINLNKTMHGFTAFREEKTFLLNTMTQMIQTLTFTDDFIPGIGIIRETITQRYGATSEKIEAWELLYSNLNNTPSSGSVNL